MTDSNTIMQLADQGDAATLRIVLRDKAIRSLYYFTKVVMGYHDLVDHFHLPFCDHVQNTWHTQRRGYLMPRFHFKSTVAKSYCPWLLITLTEEEKNRYGQEKEEAQKDGLQDIFEQLDQVLHLHDPNKRIALIGESDSIAEKNLRDIKGKIEKSQMLRWLFPELIPKPGMKWAEDCIELPRTQSFDEYSIHTFGISSRKTGLHFDLLLYDDLIGEEASRSEAEMKKAWESFQKAPGLSNEPFTVQELVFGTRWKHGTADVYGQIMKFMPETDTYEDEDGNTRNTGFTWYIQDCYDESGEPVFPERISKPILEGHRKRMGDYSFYCQFRNNPNPPEGADYQAKWIRTYTIGPDNKTIVPDDGSPSVTLSSLFRLSFWDPSAGGKSAKAENAIAGAGMSADGRKFVLKMWSKNTTFGLAIEEWHRLNDLFLFYTNAYEQVGAQKAVEDIFKERTAVPWCRHCKERFGKEIIHTTIRPKAIKPPGGKGEKTKDERIRLFTQKDFEDGRIYINGITMAKLRGQILDFPHGDLVDEFDAAAYALHLLRRPLTQEEIADERDEEDELVAQRSSRTNTEVNYGGYI